MRKSDLANGLYSGRNSVPVPEWRIVALFYAVMHALDEWLEVEPENHKDRGSLYRNDRKRRFDRQLEHKYRELENLSKEARYHPELYPLPASKYERAETIAKHLLDRSGILYKG